MVRGRVYTISLQILGLLVNSIITIPPLFLKLWGSPFRCIYYVPYFLFALLCSALWSVCITSLHQDPMSPPVGGGKNPNPKIQFWQVHFHLYCKFTKKDLVHPDQFHGEIEICERKTDPEYFMETSFIFKSCLKLSFLLLPIATQKSEENLGDGTF